MQRPTAHSQHTEGGCAAHLSIEGGARHEGARAHSPPVYQKNWTIGACGEEDSSAVTEGDGRLSAVL